MSDEKPASAPTPIPPGTPERPLGDLALSFSGGGYRAAAFHLGVLQLLDRVKLLRGVVALSTVSGGSIVGAAWALSVVRRQPFADFCGRFSTFLKKTNVIHEALTDLADHREHGKPTWPSLIRSAADIYARPQLFGDTRMGDIIIGHEDDSPGVEADQHGGHGGESGLFPSDPGIRTAAPAGIIAPERSQFREVIFNSTEFRTGVDFRFRRSTNAHARFGNGNLRVPKEIGKRVRVADAVAASSCFPGGFEPLLFPDQFDWPADLPLEKVREELGEKFAGGVPLMDGGIYDNQGIDSVVLAFERSKVEPTLVISDVAAREKDLYVFPKQGSAGWLTLRGVSIVAWVIFIAAAVSAFLLAWTGIDEWREGERGITQFFLYAVPFLFSLAVVVALFWIYRRLKDAFAMLKDNFHLGNAWDDLRRLTVAEMISLVGLRVGSVMALTTKVFMKRIRGLIYKAVYLDKKYEGRRMANLIYSLNERRPNFYKEHPWLEPSQDLRDRATWAEEYPTTLWFDHPADLDRLAKCGEETICFILLEFILKCRKEELAVPGSPVAKLFAELRQEWDVMNGAAAARVGAVSPAAAPAGA